MSFLPLSPHSAGQPYELLVNSDLLCFRSILDRMLRGGFTMLGFDIAAVRGQIGAMNFVCGKVANLPIG